MASSKTEGPSVEVALSSKQEGNDHFSSGRYEESIASYTQGLRRCPPDTELCAVLYRNRAAANLKLERWKKAAQDATLSLEITPNECKALFRRAQALDKLGNAGDAFRDIKMLLHIEPKNKPALAVAEKLRNIISAKAQARETTEGAAEEIFSELVKESSSHAVKVQMAKNLAILAAKEGGAEKVFQAGGVTRVLRFLKEDDTAVTQPLLRMLASLCTKHKARAAAVIHEVGFDKFQSLISSTDGDLAVSAAFILIRAIEAFTGTDSKEHRGAETAIVVPANDEVRQVLQLTFRLITEPTLTVEGRDALIDLVVQIAFLPNVATEIIRIEGIMKLLEVAANMADRASGEPGPLAFGETSRMHISVALGKIYDAMGKDKTTFKRDCALFICPKLVVSDLDMKIQGAMALSTVVQGCSDLGNDMLMRENVLPNVLAMAQADNLSSQIAATEALAHAAGDKSRCTALLGEGVETLKELFKSSNNDRVRIRALVALCKMASTHGGNVNARTFVEGAGRRLAKQCRAFLVDEKQRLEMRKWAAEGMAFLSLDAEVKEDLVEDSRALQALFGLAKMEDKSLLYGVSTTLVNLTNSYDKPERNKELEAIGRYAGENVPQEHDWDAEEYVDKRIDRLMEEGIVTAVVALAKTDSASSREQLSRVLLAVSHEKHRGAVVQQGGAKVLIPLALEGTTKGKDFAAQALAKIGITNDPRLVFPGQKSLEVVRPMVRLLKAEHGLQQFEALMALTNLAGIDADHRKRIVREGGLAQAEVIQFEENDLLRRASTELICNLVYQDEVFERYAADTGDRIKLLVLFSGEEDHNLRVAAAGALAILSSDERVCKKIMDVKSTVEIMHDCLSTEDPGLRLRAIHIVSNLVSHSEEAATALIADKGLSLLTVYAKEMVPCSKEVKQIAEEIIQRLVDYKLIASAQ